MNQCINIYTYTSDNVSGTVKAHDINEAMLKVRTLIYQIDPNPVIICISCFKEII